KYTKVLEQSIGVKLLSGSWPAHEDSREVVLGYLLATKLFKRELRVGDDIVVKSKVLRVCAVMSAIGQQDDDNALFISSVLYRQITNTPPRAMSALVRIDSSADINLLSEQIKFQLRKQDEVRDFSVLTPSKVARIVGNVLSIVEFALMIIALISLLV
ncbi:MAG: ABC transporter permease, partial [Patescibacteria group bacterium]